MKTNEIDENPLPPGGFEFGNLLNADAQREIIEFYRALKSSENCTTTLPTWFPVRVD